MGICYRRRKAILFRIAIEVRGDRFTQSATVDEDHDALTRLYVLIELWGYNLPIGCIRIGQSLRFLYSDLKAFVDRGPYYLNGAGGIWCAIAGNKPRHGFNGANRG